MVISDTPERRTLHYTWCTCWYYPLRGIKTGPGTVVLLWFFLKTAHIVLVFSSTFLSFQHLYLWLQCEWQQRFAIQNNNNNKKSSVLFEVHKTAERRSESTPATAVRKPRVRQIPTCADTARCRISHISCSGDVRFILSFERDCDLSFCPNLSCCLDILESSRPNTCKI